MRYAPQFLNILKSYGYPDIAREQTRAFLSEVENFLDENNPEDTNRFSDSKKEAGIQLSDVITGFLGKYFFFIEENSMPELLEKKDNLNATQMKNLGLLRGLIYLSDEVSDAFFHRIAPMDSDWKNNTFLHGLPPMRHLL